MSATSIVGCEFVDWILRMDTTMMFNGLLLLDPGVTVFAPISLWALIAVQNPEAFAKCLFKETKSLLHPGHLYFDFDGIKLYEASNGG